MACTFVAAAFDAASESASLAGIRTCPGRVPNPRDCYPTNV
jgi:hypothetical protein